MSLLIAASAALLVTAPAQEIGRVDAAYDEVSTMRDAHAIERITPDAGAADHPAQLINLGVAYARQGETSKAREMLRRAARNDQMLTLETASGQWVDSRVLARRAILALDSGRLGAVHTAAR